MWFYQTKHKMKGNKSIFCLVASTGGALLKVLQLNCHPNENSRVPLTMKLANKLFRSIKTCCFYSGMRVVVGWVAASLLVPILHFPAGRQVIAAGHQASCNGAMETGPCKQACSRPRA